MVETQLCKLRGTSDTLDVLILYFIRAKRVSNCYIQEKKNCPSARVHACSTNLGFSVEVIVLVLVYGTYYVPARTAVQASCGEKHSTEWRLPPAVPLAITPTFSPWTHTSDDSYIYQLSLVLATATVSFSIIPGIFQQGSCLCTIKMTFGTSSYPSVSCLGVL